MATRAKMATIVNIWDRVRCFIKNIFVRNGLSYVQQLDAARQREEARGLKLQEVLTAKKKLADTRDANDKLRKAIKEVDQR